MNSKKLIIIWLATVLIGLLLLGSWVYRIDPYIHYHTPKIDKYFYKLDGDYERSLNDGISKNFDYDAIITGTSMTENFKSSEMDELFNCTSIKIPYAGSSFKEINDSLERAVKANPNIKYVVRSVDLGKLFDDKDLMRDEMGNYPFYLYDQNPFNDVEYVLNEDVIWDKVYPMTVKSKEGEEPGITSFDQYASWHKSFNFGPDAVFEEYTSEGWDTAREIASSVKPQNVEPNISQNFVSIAKDNPDITFYYFFTPYSALWWKDYVDAGTLDELINAQIKTTELLLECENVKLYSFGDEFDITTNLNHYKDPYHYAEWINSFILEKMKDDEGLLTKENYESHFDEIHSFYKNFDFTSLLSQEDYEDDDEARLPHSS